ncbi:MAG TPA: hypothetical protein VGB85_08080 [Nannocystis sp.]|jgi:hypothetical protein
MTARARSQRRVTGGNPAVAVLRTSGRVARRPTPSLDQAVQKTPDAGVLASAEQDASQGAFLMKRLASPWALCRLFRLFMVGALGYAVYEVVAAVLMAR